MWRVFQRTRDGQRFSIAVSEAVLDDLLDGPGRAEAPAPLHRYVLRWPMEDPGEHGMGGSEDADAIAPVEESLWEALAEVGGEPVARIRGDGTWTLVARGLPGLPWAVLAEVASDVLGREVEIEEGEDADGDWIVEHVLPDAQELSWMHSAEIVSELVLSGVDLTQPTPIRHHVFAPEGGDLEAFVASAPGGPYEIEVIDPDPEHGIPPGVSLGHLCAPRLAILQPTVWALTLHAHRMGLHYDGWEASIDERGGGLLEALMSSSETGEA